MSYVTLVIAVWALLRTIPRQYRLGARIPGSFTRTVETISRIEQAKTSRRRFEGKWAENLKRLV